MVNNFVLDLRDFNFVSVMYSMIHTLTFWLTDVPTADCTYIPGDACNFCTASCGLLAFNKERHINFLAERDKCNNLTQQSEQHDTGDHLQPRECKYLSVIKYIKLWRSRQFGVILCIVIYFKFSVWVTVTVFINPDKILLEMLTSMSTDL